MKLIGIYTKEPYISNALQHTLHEFGVYATKLNEMQDNQDLEKFDILFIDYSAFLFYIYPQFRYDHPRNIVLIIESSMKAMHDIDFINFIPFIRMHKLSYDLYSIVQLYNISLHIDKDNCLNKRHLIIHQITYITCHGNYIYIYITNKKELQERNIIIHYNYQNTQKAIKIRMTFRKVKKLFNNFIQCNRGTLVNINYIHSYDATTQTLKLMTGDIIAVSYSYKKEFKRLARNGYFLIL